MLFIPSWGENPYQRLLARHLADRGVDVRRARWRRVRHPWKIRREQVDVVHLHAAARFHSTPSAWVAAGRAVWALAALAVLRLSGTRIVWTAHDLQDHDLRHPRIDAAFVRGLARLAHVIVTHGETARRLLRNRYRLREDTRIVVIPHGPFDGYAPSGEPRGRLRERGGASDGSVVFLFLGAIREYKGVEDLLEAFARVEDRAARLWIRGRVRDPELARRLAKQAAADPRVDFVDGFVADADVADTVLASDVVVAPYRRVLTSGSVVLGTGLGRPCIAPELGGIPDVLDSSCGWVYGPFDADALTAALDDALARRDELPAMGERARERAHRTDWPAIAEMTEAIYRG